jgi:hypothetical protein
VNTDAAATPPLSLDRPTMMVLSSADATEGADSAGSQSLLEKYRSELVRQSRLLDQGGRA